MSVTVDLPDAALQALEAEAARRGLSVEALVEQSVQEHIAATPPRRQLGFIGIGESGETDGGERHRDIIREAYANKSADDV